jgi:hypothetical protein
MSHRPNKPPPKQGREEEDRVLGAALEKTRTSLGLADDPANGIIAKRLIELAKAGERNPDLLCEGALGVTRNGGGLLRVRLPAAVRLNGLRIVPSGIDQVQFPCPFPAKRGA